MTTDPRYFHWLMEKASKGAEIDYRNFTDILEYLFQKEFYHLDGFEMDKNRASDGKLLRQEFNEDTSYICMVSGPCRVLELMISLASRCENDIMGGPYEDRIGLWFWCMMTNLGCLNLENGSFDPDEAEFIVTRFLDREYEADGVGSIFNRYGVDSDEDFSTMDLWYQMNRWIDLKFG